MLSLYGKKNPPEHIPSFCAPRPPASSHPLLIHPNFRSPGSPAQLPLHVATVSIVCLTCLCSRELCKGVCIVVFLNLPKLPPGGESP